MRLMVPAAPLKDSMAPRASSKRRAVGLAVPMPMVEIGDVRVIVDQGRVPVGMRVRLCHRTLMRMLVMLVVHVQVLVLDRLMGVEVLVAGPK